MVSNVYATLEDLPAGARIGTSSLRRELMLRAHFPQLTIDSIRGNVGTRLTKLDKGEFDALVLAAAGLKRLGFASRIRQVIPTDVSLPAPGQGRLESRLRAQMSKPRRCSLHLTMPRRAPPLRPSAVCRAGSAAAARCRWPPMPKLRVAICGCERW